MRTGKKPPNYWKICIPKKC